MRRVFYEWGPGHGPGKFFSDVPSLIFSRITGSYRQLVFLHDALRASGCFVRYMLMQLGRIVRLQKHAGEITMTGELWLNFNALEFRLQFSVFVNLPR